jgi:hypothetical protein
MMTIYQKYLPNLMGDSDMVIAEIRGIHPVVLSALK